MRSAHVSCIALVFSLVVLVSAAHAQPPFFEKFQDMYGRNAPPDFQEKIKAMKCNICHVKDEPKKVHNEYGEALKKAGLSKQQAKDLKDPAKAAQANKDIEEAFKKVEEQKNSKGEKFGDRIKAGKLPVE